MSLKRLSCYLIVILPVLLAACHPAPQQPEPEPPGAFTAELAFDRAAAGDLVTVLTANGGAAEVLLSLGGVQLTGLQPAADGLSLQFTVPGDSAAGPLPVHLRHAETEVTEQLTVLGAGSVSELLLIVGPEVSAAQLNVLLASYGLDPALSLSQLNGAGLDPVCFGQLALVQVPVGTPSIGELLAQLEAEEIVLHADPKSEWGLGTAVDPLLLNGTVALQQLLPDADGSGITIAVLDTGVALTPELGERLLPQYPGAAGDVFVSKGHGTAAAVLAAGDTYGVATGASVLPVQVCDALGNCLASDVISGVCHALNEVDPAEDGLVLSLSLGGDTEVRALSALLASAARRGAVVVAAGGNEAGAPPHWPAAAAPVNPGLLAVAALQVTAQTPDWLEDEWLVVAEPVSFAAAGTPLLSLELLAIGGNGYIQADTNVLNWSNASGRVELLEPADAVRFVLSAPGLDSDLRFSLDGTVLDTSAAELLTEPLLADGVLLQATEDVLNDRIELLLDPVPASFGLEVSGLIEVLELDLISVTAPAGYTTGDYLSLAAPGVNLRALDAAGAPVGAYSGTSFATPQVAGAAAVLLQLQRDNGEDFDAEAVAVQLTAGALPVPAAQESEVGAGRLDLRFLSPPATP